MGTAVKRAALILAMVAAALPMAWGGTGIELPSLSRTSGATESGASTAAPAAPVLDPALAGATGTPTVIVRAGAGELDAVRAAVTAAGGTVHSEIGLVDAIEASIPAEALAGLADHPGVRSITADSRIEFETLSYDSSTTASNFVRTSGASEAWKQSLYGNGVGVAVIDTGVSTMKDMAGRLVHGPDLSGEGSTIDTYGHGTVMAGIIGGNGADSASLSTGAYTGVAPKATLVGVKVAGANGVTDVSTVLHAMHWVAAYKDQFNIRVLNLSWGTASTQDPRLDPLNYAVQRLWSLGVVVVVAAGNSGPNPGTITKPADDPVVLTVGAYNDERNLDPADDNVPNWSSQGPTAHGVAKPDVVASGRLLIASRSLGSTIEKDHPKALVSPSYIRGSGSSQAAAVTSGLAALLLQARPHLTPDQVKHVLMSTASPISGYSAGAQGKGRVGLAAALTADPGLASWQTLNAGGLGSIEASRGGRNVQTDCGEDGTIDIIQGEIDTKCIAWDGNSWTGNAWTGNSWTGNSWTGNSWTGNSWTGNSWTNASWTGNSWTGGTWTGSSWYGNSWTGNSWTGNSWTGNSWTGSTWTGNSWTGNSWTGNSWTGSTYDDDTEFLSVFWGSRPAWWQHVPGEVSDPLPLWLRAR